MDLSPTRTTVSKTKIPWRADDHGVDSLESITLDITNGGFGFTTAGGTIPEGTPIKKHTASGFYRRVVTTSGSEEKADGHLFEDVVVKPGSTKVGGSLFWHGKVIDANVPGTFVDANRADHIRYV